MHDLLLRELTPAVIGVLVRRGVDFATAEDAVQDALVQAALTWPDQQPADPRAGWSRSPGASSSTPAGPRSRGATGSGASRTSRRPADRDADDTLRLFFLCAHPSLTAASAVALTLRAVGGLTTRQIAGPTSCRRRRWRSGSAGPSARSRRPVRRAGDLATVRRVLYLVFNEGYTGDVDLAGRGDPAHPAAGVEDRRRERPRGCWR
jgi:predicted RNA polymerase sigma factor